MKKQFVVEIAWGKDEPENNITRRAFKTKAERDAYMQGVVDAEGWAYWQYADELEPVEEVPANGPIG